MATLEIFHPHSKNFSERITPPKKPLLQRLLHPFYAIGKIVTTARNEKAAIKADKLARELAGQRTTEYIQSAMKKKDGRVIIDFRELEEQANQLPIPSSPVGRTSR